MHMAARPGFLQKHLPVRIDADSGNLLSGGRYLFDTVENAENYKSWAENDFVLDGIKFFERSVFFDSVCYVWRVVGAHVWADFSSHALIRSERWRLALGHEYDFVQVWLGIVREAEERGMASVWLLYNEVEQLAGFISIVRRLMPVDFQHPDDADLSALETSPSLGT